jgi:hypothetical protein
MKKEHDQLGKHIAREMLELFGDVDQELEVPAHDAQHLDIWFIPRLPLPADLPGFMMLLARILSRAIHLELWSTIPGRYKMHEVERKRLDWHYHLRVQARKDRRRPPPLFPIWTITPGKPRALFRRARVRRAPGLPPGFHWTDQHSELWFVVASELEPTRETIILRLLGRGSTREAALREIDQIPAGDPDLPKLLEFRDLLQRAVARDKNISDEDRSLIMTEARAEQLKFMEEVRGEGKRIGRTEGIAATLLGIYQQRLGAVPSSVRGALSAIDDAHRLSGLLSLFLNGSADDIARALLS